MTTALQEWEAESPQDSRLKARSGYHDSVGADLQFRSTVSFPRRDFDPSFQRPFAFGSTPYQPGPGLAKKLMQGIVSTDWLTSRQESRRLSGPIQFVLKLLDSWRLTQGDVVALLGYDESDSDLVRAVLEGCATIHGRDVRDRIAHLFQIRKTLATLFRDLDVENEWLRESHALLEGREPLSLLLGGSMENLLLVREYVDAAAGR